MATIQDFKTVIGGGVRPNQFSAQIIYPGIVGFASNAVSENSMLLIKNAQLPGSTIGNIDVFFRGRAVKVPGDRVFQDFTMTILNDKDFLHKNALDTWANIISDNANNTGTTSPSLTYGQIIVNQLNREGDSIRSYLIQDVFPTEIAAVELSLDTNDAVEEFTVTFSVNTFSLIGVDGLISAGVSGITGLTDV